MERVIYNLPVDWSWIPLGKVATLLNGRAYKQAELLAEGPTPVLRVGNFFSNRSWYYSDLDLPADKYCEEGDLLYAWSASFGPKIWQGPKAIYHYHIWKILPSEHIDKKFLFYLLEKDSEDIKAQGNGVGMFHATKGGMEKMLVPLPPINEQKRIVDKLDALLTRIDTAIEHLQESVTLADALVKSSLSAMLTKQEHWDKVSLSDVCQITSKLCDPREEQYLDMFHIGGANIASFNGELIGLKTAREEKLISGKFPFDNSMVLYSKIRPYLMKVARPSFSGICSADIYPLTPDNQKMSRDFLFYLLLSDLFTQYAIEGSSRAGMPKVNRNHLFNFEFYLPPIDEQKSICESLDALVEKTNEVSKELTGKLSYLAGLKASILDSAFKGEL
ncbi:restriction endonuclease subunit S [Vibrio navarrensis]